MDYYSNYSDSPIQDGAGGDKETIRTIDTSKTTIDGNINYFTNLVNEYTKYYGGIQSRMSQIGPNRKMTLTDTYELNKYKKENETDNKLKHILKIKKDLCDKLNELMNTINTLKKEDVKTPHIDYVKKTVKIINDLLKTIGIENFPCLLEQTKAKEKYLKYKMKYLELKRQIEEGLI